MPSGETCDVFLGACWILTCIVEVKGRRCIILGKVWL